MNNLPVTHCPKQDPDIDKIAGSGIGKINRSTGRSRFSLRRSTSCVICQQHVCRMLEELSNMQRAKESAVWRYFTLATATTSTAVCNVCKVNVSRGGGSTVKYNLSTNLIKHIQKHHTKEYAEFLQLNKTKGERDSTANYTNFDSCTSMTKKSF